MENGVTIKETDGKKKKKLDRFFMFWVPWEEVYILFLEDE